MKHLVAITATLSDKNVPVLVLVSLNIINNMSVASTGATESSPHTDAMSVKSDGENPQKNQDQKSVNNGKSHVAVLLAAFSSLGGWFFGYDQGVTGGIVVMRSFKKDFCFPLYGTEDECNFAVPALPSEYRRFLLLFTLMYNVGCFIGAVFISSFVAERFGRRAIIFTASVLFLCGTSMVIFPPGGSKSIMILILVGRVVEGTGVGCSSFSCPLYASEIAPTKLRGMLSGFMQMTVVTGLFIANVVNLLVKDHPLGWRLANGVILVAPITIMIGIFFCPESPRWLFKNKGAEAAEKSLKRIRKTDDVRNEIEAITDAVKQEGEQVSIKELFTTKKLLQRLGIGVAIHILQQATGINPIFNFGGIIYESVIGDGILSLLILSGANLLSTIPALFLFDRLGRRKLLIGCGLAMVIGHLVAATVFLTGCKIEEKLINGTDKFEDVVTCGKSPGIVMLVATAIFVIFFALSWGPIAWIYAAEIFPLNVRATAVSITTGSNWFMGTVMSFILELIKPLRIFGVFYLFAGLTFLAVIFVYFLCPETKGVALEDIDAEFEKFHWNDRKIINLLRKPLKRNGQRSAKVDIIGTA